MTEVDLDDENVKKALREEFIELCDIMLTLELCYLLNPTKTNMAYRICANRMAQRLKCERMIEYVKTVFHAALPVAHHNTYKNRIKKTVEAQGLPFDEYIKMGIELHG